LDLQDSTRVRYLVGSTEYTRVFCQFPDNIIVSVLRPLLPILPLITDALSKHKDVIGNTITIARNTDALSMKHKSGVK
jgi:hypothetical protein